MKNKKVKTIVFPVAGLGTRFLPATKSTPKEMLPVAEKPLIQYAFEEAKEAGIERFIFVTGRNKNSIEDHFDINYELQEKLTIKKKDEMLKKTNGWLPPIGEIIFLRQRDTLGLGHAILCVKKFVGNEPFAVTLADEMYYQKDTNILKDMIKIYENETKPINIITAKEVEKKEDVSKYGIISIEKDMKEFFKITDITEKPSVEEAKSNWGTTGKYVFDSKIFDYLKNVKPGVGGEIQLTDAIKDSLKEYSTYAYKMTAERFDCGSVMGFLKANIYFSLVNEKTKNDTKELIKYFYKKIN